MRSGTPVAPGKERNKLLLRGDRPGIGVGLSPPHDSGRNAKNVMTSGIWWRFAVRTNASMARNAASFGAPTSSMRFFHPVQMPVRTMFTPDSRIAAKSASHTAGFGSRRNFRCTSEPMYVVPVTGYGAPSRTRNCSPS